MAAKLGTGMKTSEENAVKKLLGKLGIYTVLLLFMAGCYRMVRIAGLEKQPEKIKAVMLLTGLVLLAYVCFCYRKGSLTAEKKTGCIIFYGIVMRMGYMLYTGCDVRSHDIGTISSEGYGHAAYILKLMQSGNLPESNELQFYQQPFFYIAGSIVSRIVNWTLQENDVYYLVDATKIVSCFASCLVLFVSEKICLMSGLKEKGRVLALGLIAFLPDMYLTGGRVNCDALHMLFMLLAFYYTCKWYKEQSWKHIIILALVYGFGMMNKISMGVMALYTAGVFLILLWRVESQEQLVSQVGKYMVFALISLPLGLWYAIRNAVLFGQSFLYVPDLASVPEIYCGNYSLVQRFVTWDIKNLFSTPYADPWSNYNLPVYLIKSALFGEFTYEINDVIPALLLFSAVVLVIFSLLALYRAIRNGKKEGFILWTAVAFLLCYASVVWFTYQYPYGCSMDFRYVVILGVFLAILLGRYRDVEAKGEKYMTAASGIFCMCSCAMYIWIG